jgi:RNA polymerase sigma-70 factor (ECF subfamily)
MLRADLSSEAIRLARVLVALMPDEPEALGLLALMLLHDARREARVGPGGELVLLDDQDRSRWDPARIAEGHQLLDRALRMGRPGPYQLQAAIAALHDEAPSAELTDWPQIAALYETLAVASGTPVIALNRAVAVALAGRGDDRVAALRRGLALVDELAEPLAAYPYLHAARADLLRRLGRKAEAREAYERARGLTANEAERAFLAGRIAALAAERARRRSARRCCRLPRPCRRRVPRPVSTVGAGRPRRSVPSREPPTDPWRGRRRATSGVTAGGRSGPRARRR